MGNVKSAFVGSSSLHCPRNVTKYQILRDPHNIAPRAAVSMRKPSSANTQVSKIQRLPQKVTFHNRRNFTKYCACHEKRRSHHVPGLLRNLHGVSKTRDHTSNVLRLPGKMDTEASKVLSLPRKMQDIF